MRPHRDASSGSMSPSAMLERARELYGGRAARERELRAGRRPGRLGSTPRRFDLAISRFGTMFFADPVAAFTNIATALRTHGRLVALVWQRRELNEWALAIDAALGDPAEPPPPTADPFSLGDAEATTGILERAGDCDPQTRLITAGCSRAREPRGHRRPTTRAHRAGSAREGRRRAPNWLCPWIELPHRRVMMAAGGSACK